MRGRLASYVLGMALLQAACEGDDRASPPPGASAFDAASVHDASPHDALLDAAASPDGGPAFAMPDASFDRPETTGLPPLDVPACLADLAIDPDALRRFVSDLSVGISERATPEGRARARAYLRERYLELGYEVREHVYATGANLVAERAGEDAEMLIVSAHLDAVSGSPGADDDASGLATAFAIAAALQSCTLTHTLRVLAFDEEELGLVGSNEYAFEIASEANLVLGAIQLEMTGFDANRDGAYLLVHCDMPGGVELANTVIAAVGTLELPLSNRPYCTAASDHASFLFIGIPAIAMGEFFFSAESQGAPDPNPCYHAACDTADALDYDYMANLTAATALAVATLVGAR